MIIDYYPFWLSMPGRSANTANPNDNYKFTGHERDEEAGLTLDYMNARNYDPILGRFLQIDPLSDQFPSLNLITMSTITLKGLPIRRGWRRWGMV